LVAFKYALSNNEILSKTGDIYNYIFGRQTENYNYNINSNFSSNLVKLLVKLLIHSNELETTKLLNLYVVT